LRPPSGITLLLGGARSGKSDLAVRIASAWSGPVTFVATADDSGDEHLGARIARHRAERPSEWTTVEAPRDLAMAVRDADPRHLLVVDCITIWVSNLMLDGFGEDTANPAADELLGALSGRDTPSIIVSNEVGMGVHPSSSLGREYRDVLGRVNRRLSEGATSAWLVVAGRVIQLHEPEGSFR
jgi:adenosylcobinamide kinase/adenosylcobinamide-phosphate guanylyltransferase